MNPQSTSENTYPRTSNRNEDREKLKEEVEKLKSMLGSTSIACSGEITCSYGLLVSDTQDYIYWVMDIGATNYCSNGFKFHNQY